MKQNDQDQSGEKPIREVFYHATGDTRTQNTWFIDHEETKIVCPKCGEVHSLKEYTVHSTGNVFPTVRLSCGFNSLIRLQNWGENVEGGRKLMWE